MTFLKVVSLKNLPLTFLHFLNVVIPMKVLWTRSTSAKHTRQKMKCKEWTIKETFLQYYKMDNHTKYLWS